MGESPKSAGEMTYDLVVSFNGLCLVLSICSVVCVRDNSTHNDNTQSQRVWNYPYLYINKRKLPSLAAEQSSNRVNRLLQLLNAYVTDLQAITVTQETDTTLLVEETWVVQVVNSVWVVTLTVW